MRIIDRVLSIIRAHPDGISTVDIARMIYPDHPDYTGHVFRKAQSLEKCGLVEIYYAAGINRRGARVCLSFWRPCE